MAAANSATSRLSSPNVTLVISSFASAEGERDRWRESEKQVEREREKDRKTERETQTTTDSVGVRRSFLNNSPGHADITATAPSLLTDGGALIINLQGGGGGWGE